MATSTTSRRSRSTASPTKQSPSIAKKTIAKSTPSQKPALAKASPALKAIPVACPRPHVARIALVARARVPAHSTAVPTTTTLLDESADGALVVADQSVGDETALVPTKPPLITRFAESLASVQGDQHNAKKRPRWFKIATWLLVLLPAFSILIYVVGFFYFWPYEQQNIGLNTSFSITPTATLGDILIPDQKGVFLQEKANGQSTLSLILGYNSRSLQPPPESQPHVLPTGLQYVLVRQAQVEAPAAYHVFRIAEGQADQPVKVTVARVPFPRVAMMSIAMPNGQPWPPGQYMVVIPEAGMDSASYWQFFTVA